MRGAILRRVMGEKPGPTLAYILDAQAQFIAANDCPPLICKVHPRVYGPLVAEALRRFTVRALSGGPGGESRITIATDEGPLEVWEVADAKDVRLEA